MADDQEKKNEELPPKLKLNKPGDAENKPDESPEAAESTAPESPPREEAPKKPIKLSLDHVVKPKEEESPLKAMSVEEIDIPDLPEEKIAQGIPSDPKSDTSMIDLAAAEEITDEETQRLEAGMEIPKGIPSDPKKDTSILDLDEAEEAPKAELDESSAPTTKLDMGELIPSESSMTAAKNKTMRVDLDDEEEEDDGIPSAANKKTMRVDLAETVDEGTGAEEAEEAAEEIDKTAPIPAYKNKTMRVDLDAEDFEDEAAGPLAAAKKKTMRVSLDETGAGAPAPEKKGTMKVSLDEQETRAGASPDGGPRTIKIKRPAPNQATVVGGAIPREIQSMEEAAAKGATAKLELPESQETQTDQGERRTIRIKRPSAEASTAASGGKTLKISRPAPGARADAPERYAREAEEILHAPVDNRPSALYAVAALLAFFITGVLVYLLMTQMPWGGTWDWPGKLIYYSHIRF